MVLKDKKSLSGCEQPCLPGADRGLLLCARPVGPESSGSGCHTCCSTACHLQARRRRIDESQGSSKNLLPSYPREASRERVVNSGKDLLSCCHSPIKLRLGENQAKHFSMLSLSHLACLSFKSFRVLRSTLVDFGTCLLPAQPEQEHHSLLATLHLLHSFHGLLTDIYSEDFH